MNNPKDKGEKLQFSLKLIYLIEKMKNIKTEKSAFNLLE